MDDLLREFLTETNESLDRAMPSWCASSRSRTTARSSATSSGSFTRSRAPAVFSGSRLEALAHSAENLMGEFRDGMPVTTEAVTVILSTIDRIKTILEELEAEQREPIGE
jgi:two-component system, chemotaxis family, sensor kinase CheA